MIVWVAAFAGLIWCWYMEGERHRAAVERREIDRMADESRRNRPELRRLEKRRESPSRSSRWATKSPRLAGRG